MRSGAKGPKGAITGGVEMSRPSRQSPQAYPFPGAPPGGYPSTQTQAYDNPSRDTIPYGYPPAETQPYGYYPPPRPPPQAYLAPTAPPETYPPPEPPLPYPPEHMAEQNGRPKPRIKSNRHCRDIPFLIAFALFLLGMLINSSWSWNQGAPPR